MSDDVRTCTCYKKIKSMAVVMSRKMYVPELSTGRMDPRVGSGQVGPGRVGSGHDFAGFLRVGSGQHFGFFSFLLTISWYLNRYEFSNTTFGLIDSLRYLIYNN